MRSLTIILIIVLLPSNIFIKADENKIFNWNASYLLDIAQNFYGGKKKGNTLMGLLSLEMCYRTDRFIEGGSLNFNVMSTHGKGLSANYIGDVQYISNIENGNYYFFLQKLYYHHTFERFSVSFGLQDLNQEFLVSYKGICLTHSACGIPSTFPLNFGVPIYPKTALALTSFIGISELGKLRMGLFDGNAGSLENDRYNIDWRIQKNDGFIGIIESECQLTKQFIIKLGGHMHTGKFKNLNDTSLWVTGNYGIHSIIDATIYDSESYSIGSFIQITYHSKKINNNPFYMGAGLTLNNLFTKKNDIFAIGFAYLQFYDKTYECDIECNYKFNVYKHLYIQPCIHYIINPGGGSSALNNSFAGFLRIVFYK